MPEFLSLISSEANNIDKILLPRERGVEDTNGERTGETVRKRKEIVPNSNDFRRHLYERKSWRKTKVDQAHRLLPSH
jgi:hypothetical protein